VLIGSGSFRVDQLAAFTAFEKIRLDNATNTFTNLTLGSQPIEVDATGYLQINVGSPSNWNSSDIIDGDPSQPCWVTFAGATGTLKLDDSQHYTGTVAGLVGQDAHDLADINLINGTTTATLMNATSAGGTLQVSDYSAPRPQASWAIDGPRARAAQHYRAIGCYDPAHAVGRASVPAHRHLQLGAEQCHHFAGLRLAAEIAHFQQS
jgi:hypothetical protein